MKWLHRLLPWLAPLGSRGEAAAARFLKQHQYRILHRNLRTRIGEIDLVAQDPDGRTIVFIEVKTGQAGSVRPEVRVGPDKQRRIVRLAVQYVRKRAMIDRPIRFDIMGVDLPPDGNSPVIRHYRAAFESTA